MATAQERSGVEAGAEGVPQTLTTEHIGFDWIFIVLCTWLIGGVFLDGWAHTHGKVDQSFFTPWHAVLYSGYLAVAIFLAVTIVRNHAQGAAWLRSYPAGYGSSVIGAAIFAVAGVGDLLWHTLFGIEKGIEGEISPSHLALALGGTLIFSGALRAAWQRTDAARRWRTLLPPLLALTYIFSLLVFFTQFADPIVTSRANLHITDILIIFNPYSTDSDPSLSTKLGVAGILLQAAIMTGVLLVLVRRWRLPLGSFALLLGLNGLMIGVLTGSAEDFSLALVFNVAILSALIGLLIDALNVTLRPSAERVVALRVFAFAAPCVYYLVYFAALFATDGSFGWSVHLWTGSIVMAGIVGLLLSYVMAPPKVAST